MTFRSKLPVMASTVFALAGLFVVVPALATPPVVQASASVYSGPWPLTVQFSATATDPDGGAIVRYHWYFADGYTSEEQNPVHTYNCYGVFPVLVTVYDSQGETGSASLTINANQVLYSSSVVLKPVVKYSKGKLLGGSVQASVVVKDSEGYFIGGALVQATWTTPTGTFIQTAVSDGAGVASFSVAVPKGANGVYALTVTGISKTNCFFDSSLGVLFGSVPL